jgi:Zn-dependent protease with chaperone function
MSVWRTIALSGACLFLSIGSAQEVRETGAGNGSALRRYERLAAERGLSSYPKFGSGEKGTVIDLHFDYGDLDITFTRPRTIPIEELLEDARRFVQARNQPEADFITFKGHQTMFVDVEFNDYLPKGRKRTVEFDIDALIRQVSVMETLESPIWIVIDPSEADSTVIHKTGEPDKEIQEVAFFHVDGNATGTVISQSAELLWYALPLLIILAGGALCLPVVMLVKMMRMPLPADPEQAGHLKTPAETQQEYEKSRKKAVLPFLPILFVLPLVLFGTDGGILKQAFRAMPSRWFEYVMVVPVIMVAMTIAAVAIRRRQIARAGIPKPKEDADTRTWSLMSTVMIWPFAIGMFLLIGPRLFPGLREYIPLWFVRALPILLPAMLIVPLVIGGLMMRRKNHRSLDEDDPYRVFAEETAERVGAKVRNVRVYDVEYVNAMVTLADNVVLTRGLLEKMEPDEIKAVIAHEIGHQRSKHVRRFFLLSLCVIIPLIALQIWFFETFPKVHPIFRSPIVTFPVAFLAVQAVLGKLRRNAEHEADLFAVDVMDEPELVIRALNKMAHINQTPTKLVGLDEKLSSHPSIANREKAIRERFCIEKENDIS